MPAFSSTRIERVIVGEVIARMRSQTERAIAMHQHCGSGLVRVAFAAELRKERVADVDVGQRVALDQARTCPPAAPLSRSSTRNMPKP